MINEFMNCECKVVVSFSSSCIEGGVASSNYFGQILFEDNNFIKMDVSHITCDSRIGKSDKDLGLTIINKNYIVAISKK